MAREMAREMAQELRPHGVTVLSLWPGVVKTEAVLDAVVTGAIEIDLARAESPRFCGRCVAALAMDPDIADKTGGAYRVSDLAREYRFTDPDRAA
jgi:dehydrogenase/reductase SDR family member 1